MITWLFGVTGWFALTACIAPFLLLRTDESTVVGIGLLKRAETWFNRIVDSQDRWKRIPFAKFVMYPVGWLLFLAADPIVRFGATVYTVVRHPIITFKTVPLNWYRIACCVDVTYPLEIVPDNEKHNPDSDFVFSTLWQPEGYQESYRNNSVVAVLGLVYYRVFIVLLFGPVLL